jgi:hypothetical protein
VCYDFKERRIMPTHYTIRTNAGDAHLASWLVETSVDGESWQQVAREKDNERLVNISRNHYGNDCLQIAAWEIVGTLFE